ncbi:His-Xaa-Ser system protein HxsD [Patescibacteria group bacterium]|nr:His-Xaa-Ser system protein HxsD [Patescibacteria group bacterium]
MKMIKSQINSQKNQITFFLDNKIYPLEAIYSTAHVFLDRAYVFLDENSEKKIIVNLKGKKKISSEKLKELYGEFCNELLNYLLRVKIAERNKKVRDFVVGTALVSASPMFGLSQNSSGDNYKDDPLGIAVPWEEKYEGDKVKKKKINC